MAKLSYSIALNLLTGGVKKGIAEVKDGFSALQAKVVTFASAMSLVKDALSAFSGQVLDIFRKTNQAVTALQNVSGSTLEYAKNQKFVNNLADKYGTNINDLSYQFTQFTAASKLAGMPMKQQEALFTSLARATAAFALNAEDTNSVFLALSQMMGKGKIQAQELRLQMGEKLPVAIQAMAKAAGGSVGQMEKMMQKGELLSAKVLPKFGKALDEMIPNVNTDHLETSLQRLDNAKIKLFKSTPVSDMYKGVIDSLTGALNGLTSTLESVPVQKFMNSLKMGLSSAIDYIKQNFRDLVVDIAALIAGIKLSGVYTKVVSFTRSISGAVVTNATMMHTKVRSLESTTERMKGQIAKEEVAIEQMADDERLYAEVQLNEKKQQLAEKELALTKAKNTEKVAVERAAAIQSGDIWKATGAKIAAVGTMVGNSLKAIWSTVGPMAIITLLTEIAGQIMSIIHEEGETKRAWNEYKQGAKEAVHTQEIEQLKQLQRLYDQTTSSSKEHKNILTKINSLLGTQLTNESDINKVIRDRIKLLEATASVNYFTQRKLDAQSAISDIYMKYGGKDKFEGRIKTLSSSANPLMVAGSFVKKMVGTKNDISLRSDRDQVFLNNMIISNSQKQMDANESYVMSHEPPENVVTPQEDPNTKKKKLTPAEREMANIASNFFESRRKLEFAYNYSDPKRGIQKHDLLSTSDYEQQYKDLVFKTLKDVAGSNYKSVRESNFAKGIAKDYSLQPSKEKIENDKKWDTTPKDYQEKLKTLGESFANGAITQDEYSDALKSLLAETVKTLLSSGKLTEAQEKYVNGLKDKFILEEGSVTYGNKNAWDDYKKTKTERMQDQVDQAQSTYDTLKDEAQKYGPMLNNELETAKQNVLDLTNKLHLQQAQDDLKEFNKQLTDSTFDTIDGVEQLGTSWAQFAQSMSSTDTSTIQKLLSLFDTLKSTVQGILSIMESIKKMNELIAKTSGAEKAIKDLSGGTKKDESKPTAGGVLESAKEIKNLSGGGTIKGNKSGDIKDVKKGMADLDKQKEKSAGVDKRIVSQGIQSSKDATAASTTASAVKEMTAKKDIVSDTMSTASKEGKKAGESTPWPESLLAIAAAITAVFSIMGALGAFAEGGVITGGTTTGDLGLARVNAGEMILNGTQQKTLFNAIKQGNIGGGGGIVAVDGRVRGDSIYLALHNYMNRTGKSL
jgi:tape measure domain-containing protein